MILRRIARPLLAATFVYGGINALRQLEGHAEAARPWLDKTVGKNADRLPEQVPTDAKTLVQIDAAVKIGAGAALAFGKAPRVAALLLLGSLVPTTLATHPFWEEDDPAQREAQLVHFLKNCGLAGGLLLAAADTHGKPSAAWWARHEVREAGKWAVAANAAARRQGKQSLSQARQGAKHSAKHAKHGAQRAQLGAGKARKGGLSKAQGGMLKGVGKGAGKGMGKAGKFGKAKKGGGGDLRKAQDGLRQMQQGAMQKAQEGMRQAQAGVRQAQAGARKAQHNGAMQGTMHRVQHGAKQAQRSTQARVARARAEAQARAARTHARQARGHAKRAVSH